MKKKLLSILLMLLMNMYAMRLFAHDIAVANADGVTIYYIWINNKTELAVSYGGSSYIAYSFEYSDNIVIPESVEYEGTTYSVTSIGSQAFRDCRSLASVIIPNSVTSIDEAAFAGCSGLTSITIPNSVTSIGGSAFEGCSGLISVTIGNSVSSIGEYTFLNCSSLTSVTIGNSVKSISKYAFENCFSLIAVHVTDIEAWCKFTCVSDNNPFGQSHHLYYNDEEITDLIIPNSVTSIGANAFAGCSGLTSVTIPNSVTDIESFAFYECSSLTSVNIPNSVISIGNEAFQNCI